MERQPPQLVQFTHNEIQELENGFQDNNLLGRGAFGNVFKGRIAAQNIHGLGSSEIAVKVGWRTNDNLSQYNMERNILGSISPHESIVKLIGYHDNDAKLYLVYEYMSGGTLKTNIPALDWPRTAQILTDMALVIEYLHGQEPKIIFRDMKSENIMLDNNSKPKLTDFGLAYLGGDGLQFGGSRGSSDPDAREGDVTPEADIFSLGILILELLTKDSRRVHLGELPVWVERQKINRGTMNALKKEKMNVKRIVHKRLQKTGCGYKDAKRLIKLGLRCVSDTKSERPTIDQVCEVLTGLKVGESQGIISAMRWAFQM